MIPHRYTVRSTNKAQFDADHAYESPGLQEVTLSWYLAHMIGYQLWRWEESSIKKYGRFVGADVSEDRVEDYRLFVYRKDMPEDVRTKPVLSISERTVQIEADMRARLNTRQAGEPFSHADKATYDIGLCPECGIRPDGSRIQLPKLVPWSQCTSNSKRCARRMGDKLAVLEGRVRPTAEARAKFVAELTSAWPKLSGRNVGGYPSVAPVPKVPHTFNIGDIVTWTWAGDSPKNGVVKHFYDGEIPRYQVELQDAFGVKIMDYYVQPKDLTLVAHSPRVIYQDADSIDMESQATAGDLKELFTAKEYEQSMPRSMREGAHVTEESACYARRIVEHFGQRERSTYEVFEALRFAIDELESIADQNIKARKLLVWLAEKDGRAVRDDLYTWDYIIERVTSRTGAPVDDIKTALAVFMIKGGRPRGSVEFFVRHVNDTLGLRPTHSSPA